MEISINDSKEVVLLMFMSRMFSDSQNLIVEKNMGLCINIYRKPQKHNNKISCHEKIQNNICFDQLHS